MAIAMKGFHHFQISVVKMNKPFISLCPEITRAHALTLMDWLEDERVTCYLSVMSPAPSSKSSIGLSCRS